MPSLSAIELFAIAATALIVIPGPSVLYIVSQSVGHGRIGGMAAVLGVETGAFVHVAAAALGVAVVIASSAAAFTVLKFAGGAYLIVLGIMRLVERDAGDAPPSTVRKPLAAIYRQGVVVNVLNPKTALFFLAFLPQFIDAAAPSKALAFVALGCLFNFNSLFVNIPVAWVAAHAGSRVRAHRSAARWLTGTIGALFVLLAARLAMLERN